MWIVRLALNRPYTFVVMALLIVVLGVAAIRTSSTDIFPEVDIPVVTVIWTYNGLSTVEMERQLTQLSEFSISNTVSDIKRIESQTRPGVAVIRIFFHDRANIAQAIAQVSASSQTITRRMPPGTNPPLILRFNASSVPVIQLSLSGRNFTEGQLYDYGRLRVRQSVVTVPGATLPLPYGGAARQIQVDLDPQALQARGLSPIDVATAISAQNLTLPSGTAKFGETEYSVSLNSSPDAIAALNDVPVREVNGVTTYVRDVAYVRDGFATQTNVVRRNGERSVLLTILKTGGASTLDIVERIKGLVPTLRATAPEGMQIEPLFDQSLFVSAAVDNVLHEAVIVSCLVGALILLFLGSWRSTVVVLVSIPLSILVSVIVLRLLGQSLNVMTLGGLALAIGILVDDATVEIENIHRHLAMGKRLRHAILDGASEIAVPTFVATTCICIVFVSVVFLEGPARFLFVPMALAVVFAVFASYILSRTLIPVLVRYLVKEGEVHDEEHAHLPAGAGFFRRFHHGFNLGFAALRERYTAILRWALEHRGGILAIFVVVAGGAFAAMPFVGRDFFPTVDAGQFRLHIAAPTGTRIEETERLFGRVQESIRRIVPNNEIELVIDNIGQPDPINLGFSDSTTVGAHDGEMLVALKPKHERTHSTSHYIARLRAALPREFPGVTFYFMPGDIVSQILNFGLPQPIEVRLASQNTAAIHPLARELEARLKQIPGAADVHLYQPINAPTLRLNVDRERAATLGLTQRDVANGVLLHLSGSSQTTPTYWADARLGVNYPIAVQTPQHRINSLDALMTAPIQGAQSGRANQMLSNVATVERRESPAIATHTDVQPTYTVYASVQGRDLGGVADEVNTLVQEFRAKLPPGATIEVAGQVASMQLAFSRLILGLIFAAMLVYFLMVVNFQSWTDPLIIIMALPAALAGVVWILFATGTTFNVPSLMGAIMSLGVATANSILLITFANERLAAGIGAFRAAMDAGRTRLRPVLMTAGAMILGMIPMALGLGEGGEQNAPLARAAIGGLALATVATLVLVPVVFSVIRQRAVPAHRPPVDELSDETFANR
ncbi:MAG TPA: efflux RND transporter permease subunit [Opitutaceae bacterium]